MPQQIPFIDIPQTVFLVGATHPEQEGELAYPDSFGTAFAIAQGVFMTAGHVAQAAADHGILTVMGPTTAPDGAQSVMGGARVQRWELWPGQDVALLFCNVNGLTVLNTWLAQPVQLLTDLAVFGYAWGNERATVVQKR